jgi:capsular polysaccharide biosynthesis protein
MSDRLRFNPYRPKNAVKRVFRPSWKLIKRLPQQARLSAARIAAHAFPFTSLNEDRLYPPTEIVTSTPEWVSGSGQHFQAKITKDDPACTVTHALPKTVHDNVRWQFLMDHSYFYPETFVATIPRGFVTNRGFVITPDRKFLHDVSAYFHDPKMTVAEALSHDWRLEQLTEVDGRVAVLTTEAASLYYHWLFQLLPRYQLMQRAGIEDREIDYYYVNGSGSRFQRETLSLLGIEQSKIIEGDKVRYLKARQLVVPSIPLGGACFRPWMTKFLRDTFIPRSAHGTTTSPRRLYISRASAGYRRVLNEGAVVELLSRHQFEVVEMERLSVQEQAAVMASCEAIVAPHGGGLSNIVFCSPGAKIVEIFSPELVATYFWKLSSQLNLDYYYLLGRGGPATLDVNYPQSWDARADIEVDLDLLERTLALADLN